MSRFWLIGLLALGCCACSTIRKLSQVERREPSSFGKTGQVSEVRRKLAAFTAFAAACPAEIKELLGALAEERAEFPACPTALIENYQAARSALKREERTALEEAINSRCRSIGNAYEGTSVERLFAGGERGIFGGRLPASAPEGDAEAKALAAVREGISLLFAYHVPLDHWVQGNGEHVLTEPAVNHLEQIIVQRGCRISDLDVDRSYQTIRALEDVAKVLPVEEQRARLERFLHGMYVIQDRKIGEFFHL